MSDFVIPAESGNSFVPYDCARFTLQNTWGLFDPLTSAEADGKPLMIQGLPSDQSLWTDWQSQITSELLPFQGVTDPENFISLLGDLEIQYARRLSQGIEDLLTQAEKYAPATEFDFQLLRELVNHPREMGFNSHRLNWGGWDIAECNPTDPDSETGLKLVVRRGIWRNKRTKMAVMVDLHPLLEHEPDLVSQVIEGQYRDNAFIDSVGGVKDNIRMHSIDIGQAIPVALSAAAEAQDSGTLMMNRNLLIVLSGLKTQYYWKFPKSPEKTFDLYRYSSGSVYLPERGNIQLSEYLQHLQGCPATTEQVRSKAANLSDLYRQINEDTGVEGYLPKKYKSRVVFTEPWPHTRQYIKVNRAIVEKDIARLEAHGNLLSDMAQSATDKDAELVLKARNSELFRKYFAFRRYLIAYTGLENFDRLRAMLPSQSMKHFLEVGFGDKSGIEFEALLDEIASMIGKNKLLSAGVPEDDIPIDDHQRWNNKDLGDVVTVMVLRQLVDFTPDRKELVKTAIDKRINNERVGFENCDRWERELQGYMTESGITSEEIDALVDLVVTGPDISGDSVVSAERTDPDLFNLLFQLYDLASRGIIDVNSNFFSIAATQFFPPDIAGRILRTAELFREGHAG